MLFDAMVALAETTKLGFITSIINLNDQLSKAIDFYLGLIRRIALLPGTNTPRAPFAIKIGSLGENHAD
jgi:hypothetical protein